MADNHDGEALNDIGNLPDSVLSTMQRPLLHSRIEQYPPAKRSKADVFCTHCQQFVSDKTYRKHQRLYSNVTMREEAGITQQDNTSPGITYGQGRKETEVVSDSDDSVSEETFLGTDSDEDNDEEFEALINEEIEEIWDSSESCGVGELVEPLHASVPVSPSIDIGASSKITPAPIAALISWLTGFLLLLQAVHSTSDAVISALLKFLKVFFTVVGNFSSSVAKLAKALPSSVFVLKTATNAHLGCTKFVVCPCCHKVYRFADCVWSSLVLRFA